MHLRLADLPFDQPTTGKQRLTTTRLLIENLILRTVAMVNDRDGSRGRLSNSGRCWGNPTTWSPRLDAEEAVECGASNRGLRTRAVRAETGGGRSSRESRDGGWRRSASTVARRVHSGAWSDSIGRTPSLQLGIPHDRSPPTRRQTQIGVRLTKAKQSLGWEEAVQEAEHLFRLLGVASHRGALRFERMTALKVLPVQLAGFGSVSMYWRPDSLTRTAVSAALDCLRACAAVDAVHANALGDQ